MSDQTKATLRAIVVAWLVGIAVLGAVSGAVAAAQLDGDSTTTVAASLGGHSETPVFAAAGTELDVSGSGSVDALRPDNNGSPSEGPVLGTLVVHAKDSVLTAYKRPGSPEAVASLDSPTRHGTPLVLQALTPPDSPQLDNGWVQVLLPVRPNGTTAWVSLDDVDTSINPFSIEVDVDDFELTIKRHGAVYLQSPVGIGNGETPTPLGSFFLTDLLKTSEPDGIYGPFAYGLSGYSETLSTFNGGQGVIGIHGTNEPWALGTNVSHGCVRVDNAVIEAMATFLPLGTPVTIGLDP